MAEKSSLMGKKSSFKGKNRVLSFLDSGPHSWNTQAAKQSDHQEKKRFKDLLLTGFCTQASKRKLRFFDEIHTMYDFTNKSLNLNSFKVSLE